MICFVGRRAIALHAISRFPQTLDSVRNSLLSIRSFSNPAGSSVSSNGLRLFLTEVVTSSENIITGGVKKKKKTNTLTSNDAEHGDTVFTMLRSYGFLESHIDKLLQKFPSLHTIDISVQKPKLDFFRGIGFSGVEMGKMFSSDPRFLKANLNNKMMPNFELLCELLGDKDGALKVVKKTPRFLIGNVSNTLLPNIEILRKHGLVGENVTDLLNKPAISRLLFRKTEKLEEYIKTLKEMDCDFSMKMHISALAVLGMYSINRWDKKVILFKGFGWSEGEVLGAFKNCPRFLGIADKNLKEKLDFFMNKLNYTAAALSSHPGLLNYSFEKRIKSRCDVFNLLASNGKIMRLTDHEVDEHFLEKKKPTVTFFKMTGQKFFETYVLKYQKDVPEVLEVYNRSKESSKLVPVHNIIHV